jgi:hypothetical protein
MRRLINTGIMGVSPFVPAKMRPVLPLLGALIGLLALGLVGAADDEPGCC